MTRPDLLQPEGHPVELLAELVAGGLDADRAAQVGRHVAGCEPCRREVRAWQSIARSAREHVAAQQPTAPAALAAAVAARIAEAAQASRESRPIGERFAWLGRFVLAQVPLVRREIWPASAVIMAIGAAISLLAGRGTVPGAALALFAPLAAAVGIALIYGHENDPSLELALATPTSPRLVIVARLVVVVAWDLALSLAASLLLAAVDGPAIFVPLVSLWLGPMLLLGCMTLLLSLFTGTSVAIAVTSVIWTLRAYELAAGTRFGDVPALSAVLDAVWQTTPLTLAAAALFLSAAVAAAPFRDGLTPRGAH